MSALDSQIGGGHYKGLPIQPVEYCQKNSLGFCESSVIKYVSRHKRKNGRQDIEKAIHFLNLLLDLEYEDIPVVPVPDESFIPNKILKVGMAVTVYDNYRFAIPLKAIVNKVGNHGRTRVELCTSNARDYPVGSCVWVLNEQLQIEVIKAAEEPASSETSVMLEVSPTPVVPHIPDANMMMR